MRSTLTTGPNFRDHLSKDRRKTSLVHENEHVSELRWEEDGELITLVVLKKKGLAWRSIVNRVPLEDLEHVLI